MDDSETVIFRFDFIFTGPINGLIVNAFALSSKNITYFCHSEKSTGDKKDNISET